MSNQIALLKQFSAKLGADITLVQAGGGNTSLKLRNVMVIKASGTRLKHALDGDIFVKTNYPAAKEGACDPTFNPVATDSEGILRPSIETGMHAIIPYPVVVHIHCVDTVALSIDPDQRPFLKEVLHNNNGVYIPYTKPGSNLASSIAQAIAKNGAPVLYGLENHGLVIAGETVAEVEARLQHYLASVKKNIRSAKGKPDYDFLEAVSSKTGFKLPVNSDVHHIALDNSMIAQASGGTLYPDHVVFLGRGCAMYDPSAKGQNSKNNYVDSKVLIVPSAGLLVAPDTNDFGEEMLSGLHEVLKRLKPHARSLRYLSRKSEDELLSWDAEKYRQEIARKS